jgi:hypothetical protein
MEPHSSGGEGRRQGTTVNNPYHATSWLAARDVRTTIRAYNQSRMVQALDAWYDVVDDLREEEPA